MYDQQDTYRALAPGHGAEDHALQLICLGPRPEMINEALEVMITLVKEGLTMVAAP